jgi:Tfp pilus assembly protein FimT
MELLLVMVIIAVCAGIAAPMMRGFVHSRRLPNAAQDVENLARWCRVHSISDGVLYRLNMDLNTNRLWATKDDGTGLNFTEIDTDSFPTDMTLPDGVVLTTSITPNPDDNKLYITFDPGGRCDVGVITLHFENDMIEIAADTPLGAYHLVKAPGGR